MDVHQEQVAVDCTVSGRLFGARRRGLMAITIVGTLVHGQNPYRTADGVYADGWPDHFAQFKVYAKHAGGAYLLPVVRPEAYEACQLVGISTLRAVGHLEDEDEEILAQYG